MAKVRVGFQGLSGAYAEGAAQELFSLNDHFKDRPFQLMPIKGSNKLFELLDQGELDFAIIPIENSHSGTLHSQYDLLMQFKNLHIVGEYVFHEPYCLMALPGVVLEEIREIRSHPHVLEQCAQTLHTKVDSVNVIFSQSEDTAAASASVQQSGRRDLAAIGSQRAAVLYGLHILIKGLEDSTHCATRYYLLGRKAVVPEGHTEPRTAFLISLRNAPGHLFRALSCFALRDINVSKFESRPTLRAGASGGRPWSYFMLIEVDGSIGDTSVQNAFHNLEEFAQTVRVLGSYPRFRPPVQFATVGAFGM